MDLRVCLWYCQARNSQLLLSSKIPLISLTGISTTCVWCPIWISIWIEVYLPLFAQESRKLENIREMQGSINTRCKFERPLGVRQMMSRDKAPSELSHFCIPYDAGSSLTSSFASSIPGVASGLHLLGTCSEGFCCTLIYQFWSFMKVSKGTIASLWERNVS